MHERSCALLAPAFFCFALEVIAQGATPSQAHRDFDDFRGLYLRYKADFD